MRSYWRAQTKLVQKDKRDITESRLKKLWKKNMKPNPPAKKKKKRKKKRLVKRGEKKREKRKKKKKKHIASIPSLIYWKTNQAGFSTRSSSEYGSQDTCRQGVWE
ncbi:hypothetical protein llap_12351 [Limosa lapponica baueri]|uniref:Uncharacterized protein n=1 Tax=Limosa lapponica baueri TaxID=1758121 RepID=A0A2I0TU88_LIMLA|nr:hypothetical protein llap_12351 [Limosa lapponica baueri]